MSIHEALADTSQRGKLLLAEAGLHANLFDLRFGEPDYPAWRQLALNYPVNLVHAFEQETHGFTGWQISPYSVTTLRSEVLTDKARLRSFHAAQAFRSGRKIILLFDEIEEEN